MLTEAQCKDVVERKHLNGCSDLEYNWLGTDDQGRDVAARLIYGFRISVLFGLILTIVSSVVGVAAGAVQGYFGGWTDLLFQRFIEVWTSLPELYLLLIISSVLVPGFFTLLGILLLFSWVSLVGLVRAEFLRGRNFEYIQAARALGVSNGGAPRRRCRRGRRSRRRDHEDQSAAPNDQAMSPVFKRAGARSLRGGSIARSVSGERHAIAARTHQIRPMIRSTLMTQF
jgi:UPF0716 family protein affecting phage T7 exclusion